MSEGMTAPAPAETGGPQLTGEPEKTDQHVETPHTTGKSMYRTAEYLKLYIIDY